MVKREKRLTRRERAEHSARPGQSGHDQGHGHGHTHGHIHCIACGRHIEPREFGAVPAGAQLITCQHGSKFPTCTACRALSQMLVDDHDRNGRPVEAANAWH